jgi:FAD/FMN-containing dehydrogenase
MWGLPTDNVVSMDVVLADGSIVQASRAENADLFWVVIEVYLLFLGIYDL